jgi:hypothetical protein
MLNGLSARSDASASTTSWCWGKPAHGPSCKVKRRFYEQFLDKEIVLYRITKENRRVDVGVIEGVRVGLVLEQL